MNVIIVRFKFFVFCVVVKLYKREVSLRITVSKIGAIGRSRDTVGNIDFGYTVDQVCRSDLEKGKI